MASITEGAPELRCCWQYGFLSFSMRLGVTTVVWVLMSPEVSTQYYSGRIAHLRYMMFVSPPSTADSPLPPPPLPLKAPKFTLRPLPQLLQHSSHLRQLTL